MRIHKVYCVILINAHERSLFYSYDCISFLINRCNGDTIGRNIKKYELIITFIRALKI